MSDPVDTLSAEALLSELKERELVAKTGMKAKSGTPIADVATPVLVAILLGKQKGIYGVDGRVDHYAIVDATVKNRSESVAALFKAVDVVDQGNGKAVLQGVRFKAAYGLCDSEPFKDQPCGAFCTGFLVGPDLMATAGHCVDPNKPAELAQIRLVFGHRMIDAATPQASVATSEIYKIKEVVGRKLTGQEDWAVVRLDRNVTGRTPLELRRTGKIGVGEAVYVIGHPCGLPLKYAPGANVRSVAAKTHFVANLDTYGGNSGSPVFGADHVVQGILVRGDADFVSKGNCNVSQVFPNTGGNGEDCSYTAEFIDLVPEK